MLWRSRLIACFLIAAGLSGAAEPIWDELGLVSTGDVCDKGEYQLHTWKFKDSTGALARVGAIADATHKTPVQSGNYVVTCDGKCPKNLAGVVQTLPGIANAPLPVLRTYLPDGKQVAHSARYVIGPVGLSLYASQIPAAAAAFQFGTEAAVARYRVPKGEAVLALFDFPTPQLARQQLVEFQKIQGAAVERSGPIVGVVLNAPDPAVAQGLLKDIGYQASISWDQVPPLVIRPQTAAQIVVAGIELSGIIMAFCLLSGLAFAGVQVLRRRLGNEPAGEPMISLNLGDK